MSRIIHLLYVDGSYHPSSPRRNYPLYLIGHLHATIFTLITPNPLSL